MKKSYTDEIKRGKPILRSEPKTASSKDHGNDSIQEERWEEKGGTKALMGTVLPETQNVG